MAWPPSPTVEPDAGDLAKLEAFRARATEDAQNPRVVELASKLAKGFRPDDWWGISKEIHRFVRDGIRYQADPDKVQLPTGDYAADVTLGTGWGNCVAKTVLATALYKALGIDAEIWPVFTGPIMTHVLTRLRYRGSKQNPVAHDDGWIYGEFTIRNTELGADPMRTPRLETGALPLSGGPDASPGESST